MSDKPKMTSAQKINALEKRVEELEQFNSNLVVSILSLASADNFVLNATLDVMNKKFDDGRNKIHEMVQMHRDMQDVLMKKNDDPIAFLDGVTAKLKNLNSPRKD